MVTFPALKLAYNVGENDGFFTCYFNSANEEAVYAFLDNRIKYLDINEIIAKVIEFAPSIKGTA